MTQRIRSRSAQNQQDPDRAIYTPGDDPREFGRQVALEVFEKHVMPLIEEAETLTKD